MSIEMPQPTKRAPMVVDLEGNSAASAAGMNAAAARDVLTAIMVAPAQWQVEGRVCMAQALKLYMYIAAIAN